MVTSWLVPESGEVLASITLALFHRVKVVRIRGLVSACILKSVFQWHWRLLTCWTRRLCYNNRGSRRWYEFTTVYGTMISFWRLLSQVVRPFCFQLLFPGRNKLGEVQASRLGKPLSRLVMIVCRRAAEVRCQIPCLIVQSISISDNTQHSPQKLQRLGNQMTSFPSLGLPSSFLGEWPSLLNCLAILKGGKWGCRRPIRVKVYCNRQFGFFCCHGSFHARRYYALFLISAKRFAYWTGMPRVAPHLVRFHPYPKPQSVCMLWQM